MSTGVITLPSKDRLHEMMYAHETHWKEIVTSVLVRLVRLHCFHLSTLILTIIIILELKKIMMKCK